MRNGVSVALLLLILVAILQGRGSGAPAEGRPEEKKASKERQKSAGPKTKDQDKTKDKDKEKEKEKAKDPEPEPEKPKGEGDAAAEPVDFETLKTQFDAEKGKEPYERVLTIEKFAESPEEKTVPFLEALMKNEQDAPAIVGAAVRALGRIGSREAVTAIFKHGIQPLVKDTIMLTSISMALSNQLEDDAEEWLLKNGLNEQVRRSPEALKSVIQAIGSFRNEKKTLVLQGELKKATTPELKVIILRAFRDSRPKDAAKVVYPHLRDPDLQVQIAVLETLEAVKAKSYARDYIALLKSPQWQLRALAVDLLVMAEHPELVRLMEPLLEDPENRVRIGAVQALVAAGGDAVMGPLIKGLEKNEGRVLDDIADALARLSGKNFGTNPIQWESWWNTNKGQVEIARKSAKEFSALKEKESEQKTAVYFGLRVLSKNLAFVFDCSGSMSEGYEPPDQRKPPAAEKKEEAKTAVPVKGRRGKSNKAAAKKNLTPKIDVAKKELLKVMDKLPGGVELNVIRFNTVVEGWKPELSRLDSSTLPELTTFVTSSKPEGLTNLYLALEEIFKDPKVDTIYLLSDGAPTLGTYVQPEDILTAVSKLNNIRKVKINTIGFNLQPEDVLLMEELANRNYGVFQSR